jgi:hypothetical protein
MNSSSDTSAPPTECGCCGQKRPQLVRLRCRPDVAICSGCIGWLAAQRSQDIERVMPVLATTDIAASKAFWAKAGFAIESYSDDLAFAQRDSVEFHLARSHPPARDRGAAYLLVREVDALHAQWSAAGLPVTEVRTEPWGMREFNLVDPGTNRLRVGQNA